MLFLRRLPSFLLGTCFLFALFPIWLQYSSFYPRVIGFMKFVRCRASKEEAKTSGIVSTGYLTVRIEHSAFRTTRLQQTHNYNTFLDRPRCTPLSYLHPAYLTSWLIKGSSRKRRTITDVGSSLHSTLSLTTGIRNAQTLVFTIQASHIAYVLSTTGVLNIKY